MNGVTTRLVTTQKEFESLREVWNGLLELCPQNCSIYLTFEWISTWWKHFGQGRKLNVLIVEKDYEIIGIIPLMETEYKLAFVRLRVLETVGVESLNQVWMVNAAYRNESMEALLTYFQTKSKKSILRLDLVPDDADFLVLLQNLGNSCLKNFSIFMKERSLAPYIVLPKTWDEYFGSLGRRKRKTLRRSLNSLQNYHRVDFECATTNNYEKRLTEFFNMHQQQWQSATIKSSFSQSAYREFFQDLAKIFVTNGWMNLTCLLVDGEPIATGFGFIYGHKLYAFNGARKLDYSGSNVGNIHDMYWIKHAIEVNLEEFDLLQGGDPYKFSWTKQARRYNMIVVGKNCIGALLRMKLSYLFIRLCEVKRNGRTLPQIYSMIRSQMWAKSERKHMGLKK